MDCSNCVNNEKISELIDEQIKAKILTRLVREYRRSIQFQQSQMITQLKDTNQDNIKV
jgi:hypothetical protein